MSRRLPWPLALAIWFAIALALAFVFLVLLPGAARAHDNWVSRGNYRNAAGEWCCNAYDCKDGLSFRATSIGWLMETGELVSYDEGVLDIARRAVIPPDGKVTICRRPDGTRRCVFGPKPGF
jgi:hypothetical protein